MSYCNAVWRRRFIESAGNTFPCCQFDRRESFDLDNIKQKMLKGETVKECRRCDIQEQGGEKSMRQVYNDQYGFTTEDVVKDIEIGVDNICNLQCMICSSRASHRLYDVENNLFGITVSDKKYLKNENYKDYDWSDIESLHLYGGEPFYSPNVKEMFEYIDNKINWNNFTITGSTNCTTMPSNTLIEKFKTCKLFKFNLSIDAFGKLNDYSRSGSSWEIILKNMEHWHTLVKENANIEIEVYSTISIYNANEYDKLETFIKEQFPLFGVSIQNLQIPEWQCISNTPVEYKQMVKQNTNNETILNFLDIEGPNLFDQFVYFTNTVNPDGLDEANPNLYEFMKNYKVSDCKDAVVQKIQEYKL